MRNALLLASLAGIVLLSLFARCVEPRSVSGLDGETGFVEFAGWVASVNEGSGSYFITACAEECVTLAAFRAQAERLKARSLDPAHLRKGQRVALRGLSDGSRLRCLNEYCVEVLS